MPGEIGKCHKSETPYDMTEVMKELKSLGGKVTDIWKNANSKQGPMREVVRPIRSAGQMQAVRWQHNQGPLSEPRHPYQGGANWWSVQRNVNNPSHTDSKN